MKKYSLHFAVVFVAFATAGAAWSQAPLPAIEIPETALPAALPEDNQLPTTPISAVEPSPDVVDDIMPEAPPVESISYDHFGLSLFFSDKDIKRLKAALNLSNAAKTEVKPAPISEASVALAPIEPEVTLREYPVFHLSSIVYQGANKWVIWLNDKRTTPTTLPEGLTVKQILPDYVELQWQPSSAYPVLASRWHNLKGDETQAAPKYLRSVKSPVNIDEHAQTVTFLLRPNQTYASAFNRVIEGKHPPIAVTGTDGKINISAFEQTLREETLAPQAASFVPAPVTHSPNIVRPGFVAPQQNGNFPAQGAAIEQVPGIFQGGLPTSPTTVPSAPFAQQPQAVLPQQQGHPGVVTVPPQQAPGFVPGTDATVPPANQPATPPSNTLGLPILPSNATPAP